MESLALLRGRMLLRFDPERWYNCRLCGRGMKGYHLAGHVRRFHHAFWLLYPITNHHPLCRCLVCDVVKPTQVEAGLLVCLRVDKYYRRGCGGPRDEPGIQSLFIHDFVMVAPQDQCRDCKATDYYKQQYDETKHLWGETIDQERS